MRVILNQNLEPNEESSDDFGDGLNMNVDQKTLPYGGPLILTANWVILFAGHGLVVTNFSIWLLLSI